MRHLILKQLETERLEVFVNSERCFTHLEKRLEHMPATCLKDTLIRKGNWVQVNLKLDPL